MKKRRANPKKAVAAAMPLPIGDVRPMTLAMWAALEHIDSPLLKSSNPDGLAVLDLLPSLYLLTHDPREIFRANLLDLAMQWADTLPVTAIADIRRAAEAQMRTVAAVIPEDDEEESRKKKVTALSPTSSTTPARRSAGATAKRSTKPRSRSSRSSTATLPLRPTRSSLSR
ncbi:MAG: hypothetical protein II823_07095 [Kiritimatiellae bacterium]|nr:hypothetical protein [Kiritimatiellia bacterium]